MPNKNDPIEDMMNARDATLDIFADLRRQQDTLMSQTQASVRAVIDTYKDGLEEQIKKSAEAFDKLDEMEKNLDKEAEGASKKRLKQIEKEKQEIEKLRQEERKRISEKETAYKMELIHQKAIVDQETAKLDIQKKVEEMKKKNLSASSIMGSAKDFMSGGLKASQVDTRGYEAAAEGEREQVELLKAQLEVADESQKQQIEAELKRHEDALDQIESQKSVIDAINSVNAAFVQKVDEAAKLLEETELKSNTRLMGSNKQFSDGMNAAVKGLVGPLGQLVNNTSIMSTINKTLAASPFVKTENVVREVASGIAQGIVTNVEMRGFLNSVKDGLVSTFEAFDEKINRLIRIQQQDSTTARMGMEASLMKLYNQMFETSEYLQSGFDSVTDAIYEASAIVGAKQAEEMEFVMQKWLGSLYSVGMSQGTITGIASAINQLASGDISQVGTGTQNLIAMALSKTNLSYDKLLTSGVSASDLNVVMAAIVSYLQDIAETSQDNNVVQKELGNVFGVTMSDIKAATNLTAQDISSLLSYTQSYGEAQQELNSQLGTMITRMSKSVLLSNVYENFMLASGMTVAENPVTYFMQKVLSVLPNMEIPMPQAMGWGLSSGLPVKDLLQTALTGFGLLGGAMNAITSLASFGGIDLNAWNPREMVSRGAMGIKLSSGFTQTTSGSQYVATGSAEDLKASAMGAGKEQSEEAGETVGTGEADTEYTSSNIYKLLTGIDADNTIVPIEVKDQDEFKKVFENTYKDADEIKEVIRRIETKLSTIASGMSSLGGVPSLGGEQGSLGKEVTISGIKWDNTNASMEEFVSRFIEMLTIYLTNPENIPMKVEVTNMNEGELTFDYGSSGGIPSTMMYK